MRTRLLAVATAAMTMLGLLVGTSGAAERAGIPASWDPFEVGVVRDAGGMIEGDTEVVFDDIEAIPMALRVFVKRQPRAETGATFFDWALTCANADEETR